MSCSKQTSAGLYDRQVQTELFKRYHGTNFTLTPKMAAPILGPTTYNPKTIEEIYRQKPCGKYGKFYQQSARFGSSHRKSKHRCSSNVNSYLDLFGRRTRPGGFAAIRERRSASGRFPIGFSAKTSFSGVTIRFVSIVKVRIGAVRGGT